MPNDGYEALLASLRKLQASHDFSDLKIFCDDQVFHVHKAIEGELKNEIDLTGDDDPRIVKLMFDYLYLLNYDDLLPVESTALPEEDVLAPSPPAETSDIQSASVGATFATAEDELPLEVVEVIEEPVFGSDTQDLWGSWGTKKDKKKKKKQPRIRHLPEPQVERPMERLTVNTLMYALADKYGIDDLKELARDKFMQAIAHDWATVAFVRAAEVVFSTTASTDQGLRSIVVDTLAAHPYLINYVEIEELLNSGNGTAWKLLQNIWKDEVEWV